MSKRQYVSKESFGLLLVLISAVLYAIMGAFIKLGKIRHNLPFTQLVISRGIFQGTLVVLGLCLFRESPSSLPSSSSSSSSLPPRLILHPFGRTKSAQALVWTRGVLGGMGFLLDYHCLATLPLGDAMTLMSLYPFLTIFLAYVVLHEPIQTHHIAATLASLVGTILIAQPTLIFGEDQGNQRDAPSTTSALRWGYASGIAGACCLSCVVVLIRKAGTMGVHTFQLLLSWALCGSLFSTVLGFSGWRWPAAASSDAWSSILGSCVFGAGAHFLLNYAGRIAPAGLVSVVRASDIVWAYGLELAVFHSDPNQQPNHYTWTGCGLVLLSLLLIGYHKVKAETVGIKGGGAVEKNEDGSNEEEDKTA